MRFLGRVILLGTSAACLSSCEKGGEPSGPNESPTSTGPTTTFTGVFSNATKSGTVAIALPSAPGTAPAMATLVFLDGSSVTLSGTFSHSSEFLGVSGAGYTLAGTLVGDTLSGSFSFVGDGAFTAFSPAVGVAAATVYCGTYFGDDAGWFNIVVLPSGAVGGSVARLVASNGFVAGGGTFIGGPAVTLSGSLSGGALNVALSPPSTVQGNAHGTALGTLSSDGVSFTGAWANSAGGDGKFRLGNQSCGSATPGVPPPLAPTVSGAWSRRGTDGVTSSLALLQDGSSVGGAGNFVYAESISLGAGVTGFRESGGAFNITSGSRVGTSISFSGTIGGYTNPIPGSVSFTGTLTDQHTLTGALTYTLPGSGAKTQTIVGFTFSKL